MKKWFMKWGFITLAIIVLLVLVFCGVESYTRTQKERQAQFEDSLLKVVEISKEIGKCETEKKLLAEIEELKEEVSELYERIGYYEQDIRFWNEQVNNMFGEHNKRYFREERD